MIGIGVVGCGYWGANLIRNLLALDDARVVHACDESAARLEGLHRRHLKIRTSRDHRDLVADPAVDAVVVATPAGTHYSVAMASLVAGKHVLVAKPLATSSDEALALGEEAAKRNLTLMVGHTFIYAGAVRTIRELITAGDLGDVLYYDSVRVNLGVFQPDVNVLWDLAVHDLAILDFLFEEKPVAVSATGTRHLEGQHDNLAYLTLYYPGSMIAHMHVSWVAPVKVRRIHIGGSRRMLVYDDTEAERKVCVYDKNVTVEPHTNGGRPNVLYRDQSMVTPDLDVTEPLYTETAHFIDCVTHGHMPQSSSCSGVRVLSILEAATQSLEGRGQLVELS